MTKPREKTREELTAEIEESKKKIRQFENREKIIKQMSRDELAVMDGGKCILQLRGVRPFLSNKYDLTQHPNYKLTGDYDKKNLFDIEKFLDRRLKLKPSDVYNVVDADES